MPKAVNISVDGGWCIQFRFVPFRFKIFTGHALIISKYCIEIKVLNHLVVNFLNLIVISLRFRSRIPQTPCAREIVEISATFLSRENIKDDRLPKCDEVLRVPCGMWPACITTDGKDNSFHILRAALGQP